MQYLPTADRILVRPDPLESQTPGGIYIPDAAKERGRGAVVLAVGPGRYLEGGKLVEPCVRPGDRVVMHKHKGFAVELGGEEHLIVSEADIMAIEAP